MTLTPENLESCRSLLFIPATEERFIGKAHQRGAGAIILDLEDAVAPELKLTARKVVTSMAAQLREKALTVLVRINQGCIEDIVAAVCEDVSALVIPKAETASDIHDVCEVLDRREAELGLKHGHTRLLVLIETPLAVCNAYAIASASDRVSGLILGSEDLALSLGAEPTPDLLRYTAGQLVMAARAAGKVPLGVPGSLATIAESEQFSDVVKLARRMGMAGTVCIHPAQVQVVRAVYAPEEAAVSKAQALLQAFDKAERAGKGAVSWDGKMLDAPIVERARKLVEEAKAFAVKAA